jgi:hypothetical protein
MVMLVSNSEMHLRLARATEDSEFAIAQYMKAIDEAVRELKEVGAPPILRRIR